MCLLLKMYGHRPFVNSPQTKVTQHVFNSTKKFMMRKLLFSEQILSFHSFKLLLHIFRGGMPMCVLLFMASLPPMDARDSVRETADLPWIQPESSTKKEVSMWTQCDKGFLISANIWSNFLQHHENWLNYLLAFFSPPHPHGGILARGKVFSASELGLGSIPCCLLCALYPKRVPRKQSGED